MTPSVAHMRAEGTNLQARIDVYTLGALEDYTSSSQTLASMLWNSTSQTPGYATDVAVSSKVLDDDIEDAYEGTIVSSVAMSTKRKLTVYTEQFEAGTYMRYSESTTLLFVFRIVSNGPGSRGLMLGVDNVRTWCP
jgi:hypothetical protein